MSMPPIGELIPILQTAIGPMILISGVGLLLLSMTNRLTRVLDRVRSLCSVLRRADAEAGPSVRQQLAILEKRAGLLRWSIIWASLSALLAALLMLTLFVAALCCIHASWLAVAFFAGCMVSLVISLVAFTGDVNQSLVALKLERREAEQLAADSG